MGYHVTLPHHFSHLTVPMGCRLWPNYVSILYFFTLQDVTFRSKTRMTACINIAKDKHRLANRPYECIVLPAKSDSDFMFCLQSNLGLIIDRSRVY